MAARDRVPERAEAVRQRARMSVGQEVEAGLGDADSRGEAGNRGVQRRRLPDRKLAGADHAESHAVGPPVRGRGDEQPEEDEQRAEPVTAEQPADRGESGAASYEQEPDLEDVPDRREAHLAVLLLVLL